MKRKKMWSLMGKIVLGLVVLGLIALAYFVFVILPRGALMGAHDDKPFSYIKGMDIEKKTPSGVTYSINNGEATFHLDVAKPDKHSKQVFTNYTAALAYCREQGLPTIPSVQLIQGKLKAFDEALCITLELAIEERRLKVLKDLLTALQREGNLEAVVHVATALSLAGADPKVEGETLRRMEASRQAFLHTPEARPCGFWDTDERLRKNYQSGRYLMEGISITNFPEACIVISKLLMNDPALKAALENVQAFDAKLTNPLKSVSFETLSTLTKQEVLQRFPRDARFSLFGYSTSMEEAILSSITIQPHEQLMPLLIKYIRSGKFSLEPRPDSGWYAYQWHALETLLLPEKGRESAKLRLSKAYQKRLENAFASLLTKERETHLKRLPMINVGCQSGGEDDPAPKVKIVPEFSAEPTLTVYLRLARGYRFLRQALKATLGEAEWARLRLASERPLDEELNQTMLFCYGLYERLSLEIGQPPLYLSDEVNAIDIEEARALFDRWCKGWQEDPALLGDARVAVPVADRMTHYTYWGTAGVRLEPVVYKYVEKPNVSCSVEPVFAPCKTYLPTDFFFEFSRPSQTSLTRAEFRALCDKGRDVNSLYKAFGATPPSATSGTGLTIKDWLQAHWGWLAVIAVALLFWRVRRARLWLGLGLLAMIICWGGLLVCSPYYRTLFIVRHVATINEGMGLICEEWAIPEISRLPCVKALSTLLVDADPQVRYLAARFIALKFSKNLFVELENPLRAELKAHLLKAVEDPQSEIAYFATWALRSCHDPDVVDGLVKKLTASADYDELCRWLLHILGEIRDPRAVKAIYPLCEDPRRAIFNGAIFALGEFSKQEVLELLLELVKSQKGEVRYLALIVIRNRSRQWEGDALNDDELRRKYDELFLERMKKQPLSFESRQAFAYWIKDEVLYLEARAFNLQEATSFAQTNGVLLAIAYRALPKQLHGLKEGERFNGIVTNSPVRLEMAEAVSRKDSVAVKQALIAVMTQAASDPDPETRALAERLTRTLQEPPKELGRNKR